VFRQKGKAVSFENGGFICWVEQMQCTPIEREEALQGHIPWGIKASCKDYGESHTTAKLGDASSGKLANVLIEREALKLANGQSESGAVKSFAGRYGLWFP
jgi:hypothetical protein